MAARTTSRRPASRSPVSAFVGPKSIDIAAAASGSRPPPTTRRTGVDVHSTSRQPASVSIDLTASASPRENGPPSSGGRSVRRQLTARHLERQLEERRLRAVGPHGGAQAPSWRDSAGEVGERRWWIGEEHQPEPGQQQVGGEVAGIPRRRVGAHPLDARRSRRRRLDHLRCHVDADDAAGGAGELGGSPRRRACSAADVDHRLARPQPRRRRTALRRPAPAARRDRRPSTPTAPLWRRPIGCLAAGRRRSATSSTRATTSWAQAMNASTSPPPGSTTSSHGASCSDGQVECGDALGERSSIGGQVLRQPLQRRRPRRRRRVLPADPLDVFGREADDDGGPVEVGRLHLPAAVRRRRRRRRPRSRRGCASSSAARRSTACRT